jgi:hypothetical protein
VKERIECECEFRDSENGGVILITVMPKNIKEPKVCNQCDQFTCICHGFDKAIELIKNKSIKVNSNETVKEFVRLNGRTTKDTRTD